MERHRIAVAVFAEVEAADCTDAGHIVEMVIRRAITGGLLIPFPHTLTLKHPNGDDPEDIWFVKVVGVMDAGVAASNGYLWTKPTNKMYREGD